MKNYADFLTQNNEISKLFTSLKPTDTQKITKIIQDYGLYRTKGYFRPYLKESPISKNKFCTKDLTYIENTINLDLDLKNLLLKNLLNLESKISLVISETLSKKHTPYWYKNISLFNNKDDHKKINDKIIEETHLIEDRRHPHPGIHKFYVKYAKRVHGGKFQYIDLPFWIVREVVTFGFLTDLLFAITSKEVDSICSKIQVRKLNGKKKALDASTLRSWVYSLRILRNTCAHNSLLINRSLSHNPAPYENLYSNNGDSNLNSRVIILNLLLESIDKKDSFTFEKDFLELINKNIPLIGCAGIKSSTGIDLSDEKTKNILNLNFHNYLNDFSLNNKLCGFL